MGWTVVQRDLGRYNKRQCLAAPGERTEVVRRDKFIRTCTHPSPSFLGIGHICASHRRYLKDYLRTIQCLAQSNSVAIWLNGYYHGDRHDPVVEVNKFEDNARDLRAACRQADNFKRPIMQLIEANKPK